MGKVHKKFHQDIVISYRVMKRYVIGRLSETVKIGGMLVRDQSVISWVKNAKKKLPKAMASS